MAHFLFHVFLSSFREPRFHASYAVEIFADSLRISTDFIAYERDLRIRILDLVAHGLVQRWYAFYVIPDFCMKDDTRDPLLDQRALFSSNRRLEITRVANFNRSIGIGIDRRSKSFEQLSPAAYIWRNRGTNPTPNLRHYPTNTIEFCFPRFYSIFSLRFPSLAHIPPIFFSFFLSNSKSPWQVLTGLSGSSDHGIRSRPWQVAKRIACVWSFESLSLRHLPFSFFLLFPESSFQKFRCWAVCKLQVGLQGPSSTHRDLSRDRYFTRACSSRSVL